MPGGLTIQSVLKPGVTWLGEDAAGRRVVLKKLPTDCLRGGRLHPSIAQRLSRLREVPMTGLAHLIGVEHSPEVGVVIVSEFIDGQPLHELPLTEHPRYAAEVRRLVESLHRTGLVHGAIGPGNLIVTGDGKLKLIDPSPLLYQDPAVDLADVDRLSPDGPPADAGDAPPRYHRPSLLAAVGLSLAAAGGAAAWAIHVAGRS